MWSAVAKASRVGSGPITVAFVLLLLALLATSPSGWIVGDGDEYLRMAERIGHLRAPGGVSRHFWLYSALASPFVRAASAAGLNPVSGFTILNSVLLALTFPIVLRRTGASAAVLIIVGPVIWWLNKAHSEPFTFSMLAIGFAQIRSAPWWTFVTLALAGMQNLPIALSLPIAGAATLAMRPAWLRDRRWWAGTVAAAVLMLVALGYNLLHAGRLMPLLDRPQPRFPSLAEFGAPLWDPNLGLLPNFPGLVVVVAGVVGVLLWNAPRCLLSADIVAAAASAAAFLFGASQATNVNHGGTPGMSRYAVWLIPVAIPLLARAHLSLEPRARRWMVPVAAASVISCLVTYHPRAAERSGQPTRLALYLWTHHPSLDNPLPEVFVERINGLDDDWVPAETAGCEKILTAGRGPTRRIWPAACVPVSPPTECLEAGRLCYANRTPSGYDFVLLPRRGERFRVRVEKIERAKP